MVMLQELNNGVEPKFEWPMVVYLISIAILFVVGSYVQFHRKRNSDDFKEHH